LPKKIIFNSDSPQPTVDSILIFGEKLKFRAHVAVFPLVETGPEITLRRLPTLERFQMSDFFISENQKNILLNAVQQKKSILVAGSTGCGKTSFLTALMKSLNSTERILVLEDSPELPVPNSLSSKLLCRTDRFGFREGASWSLEDLVFESLRMRPDRLIIGECRSTEARAIAQALLTGHRGLWTSIHAGSTQEALERFSDLALLEVNKTQRLWDYCIQLKQGPQGERKLEQILTSQGEIL
jgi:pilus assembly protein CpaF